MFKQLTDWWKALPKTRRAAYRSSITSFATSFGLTLVVTLPESAGDLTWPVVFSAGYTALRTSVVALNKRDDSYGRGSGE